MVLFAWCMRRVSESDLREGVRNFVDLVKGQIWDVSQASRGPLRPEGAQNDEPEIAAEGRAGGSPHCTMRVQNIHRM